MDKDGFIKYANKKYTTKSSHSRLYRIAKAEKLLGEDLDKIVNNDGKMFSALEKIKTDNCKSDNDMKTALRNYYEYKNGKVFNK